MSVKLLLFVVAALLASECVVGFVVERCSASGYYVKQNGRVFGARIVVNGSCSLEELFLSPQLQGLQSFVITAMYNDVTLRACQLRLSYGIDLWLSGVVLSGADCGPEFVHQPLVFEPLFFGDLTLTDVELRDYHRDVPLFYVVGIPHERAALRMFGLFISNSTAPTFVHTENTSDLWLQGINTDENSRFELCVSYTGDAGTLLADVNCNDAPTECHCPRARPSIVALTHKNETLATGDYYVPSLTLHEGRRTQDAAEEGSAERSQSPE